ncbi:MAG: GIY-YIG nuclease family protein [Bauldia litoralis]
MAHPARHPSSSSFQPHAVMAGLDPAIHAIPYLPMQRRDFFVYILASQTRGTLYIGVTNDVARRLTEHRRGGASGSFTARYRVFRLVHFETFPTAAEAIRREKALKKWLRRWKIDLVERDNPTWSDLARWPLP